MPGPERQVVRRMGGPVPGPNAARRCGEPGARCPPGPARAPMAGPAAWRTWKVLIARRPGPGPAAGSARQPDKVSGVPEREEWPSNARRCAAPPRSRAAAAMNSRALINAGGRLENLERNVKCVECSKGNLRPIGKLLNLRTIKWLIID